MALPATFDEFAKLGTTGNSTEIRHIPTGFTFSVPANATVDTVYDTFDAIEETAAFDRFTQGGMLQRKQGTVVGRPQLEFEQLRTGKLAGVEHALYREVNSGVTFIEKTGVSNDALRLAYMDAAEGQGRSMTFDQFTKQTQPTPEEKQEAIITPSGGVEGGGDWPGEVGSEVGGGIVQTYNKDDHRAAAVAYARANPSYYPDIPVIRGAIQLRGLEDWQLVPSNWYNLVGLGSEAAPVIPSELAAFWIDAYAEGQLKNVGSERTQLENEISSLLKRMDENKDNIGYLTGPGRRDPTTNQLISFSRDTQLLDELQKKKGSYDTWLGDAAKFKSQIATDYAQGKFDSRSHRQTFWVNAFQPMAQSLGNIRDGSEIYQTISTDSKRGDQPIPGDIDYIPPELSGTVTKADPKEVAEIRTAQAATAAEKKADAVFGGGTDAVFGGGTGAQSIINNLNRSAREAAFEDFTPTQTWDRLAAEGQLGFAPTRELSPFARQAVTGQFRDIYQPGYATQLARASQELAAATEAAQEGQQMPTTFAGLPLDAPAGVSPFHSFVSGVQESGRMPAYNVDPIRAVLESGRVDPYSTRLIGMLGEDGLENITTQNIALLNHPALQGLSPTLRAAAIKQLKDQYTQDILLQPEMTAFAHFGMQNPAGSFALGMPQRTVPEPPGI